MNKEIGKWFMDVAKYVVTAVVITSVFGNIEQKWMVNLLGTAIAVGAFVLGLWYIKKDKLTEDKRESKEFKDNKKGE